MIVSAQKCLAVSQMLRTYIRELQGAETHGEQISRGPEQSLGTSRLLLSLSKVLSVASSGQGVLCP